jgi:hypothetical protein
MPYKKFDRDKLNVRSLGERKNKILIETSHVPVDSLPAGLTPAGYSIIRQTAEKIREARSESRSVMLAFGAHTIKNGMSPTLIALMEEGWVTHLATNGAGIIHDWEFAFQGKSSEDVKENVRLGQFGIWDETGFYINLALISGAYERSGYGESVGKMISLEGLDIPDPEFLRDEADSLFSCDPSRAAAAIDFAGTIRKYKLSPGFLNIPHPFKKYSAQCRAYELRIPFTGHPMIGHDIIYNHPANVGAAVGRTALNDFLCFTESVKNIDQGVYMSVGSAVMSPMIFEKALSMCQNIAISENRHIDNHFILVVDLAHSDWDWQKDGEPPMDNPAYYLRYCKTFSRMGGEMHYLTADNRDFLLALYHELHRV